MKKIEANQLQRLSIFELSLKGFLSLAEPVGNKYMTWLGVDGKKQHSRFSVYLPLSIHETGCIEFFSSKLLQIDDIELTSTKCNFGGVRYWFLCPSCKRRVAILYNLSGRFICRHCGNLTYSSRNQTKGWKCNVSIIDVQAVTEQVGRKYYNGKPTRKYLRLLRMEAEFEKSLRQVIGLEKK